MSSNHPGFYSFPVLKYDKIILILRDLPISVADEDIRKANPVAVRRIFEVFLETLMGVTKEELSQADFSGLSALNFPELHEESIPELAFFRNTMKMMSACGIHDFTINDLIRPEPKRCRRQLSAMINFAKFKDERQSKFGEITNETEVLLEQKQRVEDENAMLAQELELLMSQQSADEPAKLQLREECAALESEISELNKHQAVLRHEISELKERNQSLKDELTSKEYTMLEGQQERDLLQSQVVNSPARFKKEISDIAEALAEAKEDLNQVERKERDVQARLDAFVRAQKDVTKTISFLREIETDVQRCKSARRDVKQQLTLIEDNQSKTEELIARKQRLHRLMQQKMDAIENFRHQSSVKIQASDHALNSAKSELEEVSEGKKETQARVEEIERELNRLYKKKQEEEAEFVKDINEMRQVFQRLEDVIEEYNQKLLDAVAP